MTIKHFNWLAPIYDWLAPPADPDRLKELLALPQEGWLLDAGGGTGRVAALLAPFMDRAVVLDASRPMLRQSTKKSGLQPVQGEVQNLPFPNESFGRILVVDALHHFAHQPRAAEELLRVLKPGGRLLIEEFNIHRLPIKLLAYVEKILLMGSLFSSPSEIEALFAATGATTSTYDGGGLSVWIVAEK